MYSALAPTVSIRVTPQDLTEEDASACSIIIDKSTLEISARVLRDMTGAEWIVLVEQLLGKAV